MKIQNAFRLGLVATLGVLVALLIGGAAITLSTILTYIGAALFISLGLDPLVSYLERKGMKRPLAILVALVGVIGIFVGLVFALIPVIADQVGRVAAQVTDVIIPAIQDNTLGDQIQETVPWLPVAWLTNALTDFFNDSKNVAAITSGLVNAGVAIASGIFGAFIVIILVIYFVASLGSLKRGVYQFVPASKRPRFIDLAEQISDSVGRYVIGQVTLALCNGVISFILLTFIFPIFVGPIKYSALLAFIAFLGSLIPLVGTLTASIIITLSVFIFNEDSLVMTIVVGAWYLLYMQIEAYVLNPRIMAKAVKVPGVIVVIAALAGGALLGILGALIAIPVAASIQLIVKEVVVPRQNEL